MMQTINIMAKAWTRYQGKWKGHKGECFFPPTSPTGRVSSEQKNFLHPWEVTTYMMFLLRDKKNSFRIIPVTSSYLELCSIVCWALALTFFDGRVFLFPDQKVWGRKRWARSLHPIIFSYPLCNLHTLWNICMIFQLYITGHDNVSHTRMVTLAFILFELSHRWCLYWHIHVHSVPWIPFEIFPCYFANM